MVRASFVALAVWLTSVAAPCGAQPITDIPREGPIPEVQNDSIGYPSAQAALAALRAKPGVVFREEGGWTIAEERAAVTLWSFTPASHSAHPSAVKRQITRDKDGGLGLTMSVSCQATKKACDALVREFDALNDQMIKALRQAR